jgi:cytochrome oxidase assembly protein ShyY1
VQAYAAETGLPLQPFVIQQLSDDGDKLVRDWPAPTTGVERNYGYMFQWWGMAAAALGFGLYAARRAAKKDQRVLDAPPGPNPEHEQKQERESTRGV